MNCFTSLVLPFFLIYIMILLFDNPKSSALKFEIIN